MKKGSFKGLVFREFYVARKTLIGYFSGYVVIVILALLTLLSYRCGNLHRYAHLLNADTQKGIDIFVKLLPTMFAMLLTSGACDATPNDEKLPWIRFRTACPVTPFRLALAKYTCTMIIFLFSIF